MTAALLRPALCLVALLAIGLAPVATAPAPAVVSTAAPTEAP